MKILRSQITFTCLLVIASLAVTGLAVSPPPDGGYPGQNTAEGEDALFSLTTGISNTAIGFNALFNNTEANFNTANGDVALFRNTSGDGNTATGASALFSNTNGSQNTATGISALYFNTSGFLNTATGVSALVSNTTGSNNTATGAFALQMNTTGVNNTTTGELALLSNKTGNNNTANGWAALYRNTTGRNNTADGKFALLNNTTGGSNIALGEGAGLRLTTGDNNIDIGNSGVAGESDTIRIGTEGTQSATFIAGITGVTVAGGAGVIIGSNGKLGTVTSSEHFKEAIQPMDKASESILALKPVTFRYKHDLDPDGIPQFGLVAEQVEKVNPDLVARDEKGKPYTVRYEAVNAMLLNEFLKEHRKVEALEHAQDVARADAAGQQREIDSLRAALKEQAAQIQEVNQRLADEAPPPMLVNSR